MRRLVVGVIGIAALSLLVACSSDGNNATKTTPGGTLIAQTPALASQTPSIQATQQEVTPAVPFAQACQKTGEKSFASAPPRIIDTNKTYIATITTGKGSIVLQLSTKHAVTANNFVFLACKGFYDGLKFHRVEAGFVIQGGDPQGNGQGGPGYTIPGEFDGSNFVTGVIGMARLPTDPNSAGSQFYIMLGDAHSLDGQYADFGKVTSGQDVAGKIQIGDAIDTIVIEEK